MQIRKLILETFGKTQLFGGLEYFLRPSSRNNWSGPFNAQKFRQEIFRELIEQLAFSAIIETGTKRGTTTEFMQTASHLPVYTVEILPRYLGYARARFLMNKHVVVVQGDSRKFLRRLASDPKFSPAKTFFYLDAHGAIELPLREELRIVFEGFTQAVVMVDDFKVPDDPGYAYDEEGGGKILCLEYLHPLEIQLKLATFFPAQNSEFETGAKKGCVVFARDDGITAELKRIKSLRFWGFQG